jgi:hypothetical protein
MEQTNGIRGMIDRRLLITLLGLLVGLLLDGPTAFAQQGPTASARQVVIDHEYEYKAAYLYHFAGLCTWPQDEEGTSIVVGVLGPNRFGRQLERIRRQSANSRRPIETLTFPDVSELEACDILFVSGRQEDAQANTQLAQVMERLNNQATLVFTEVNDREFFRQGVAVNFYIENNRLKLLINLQAAKDADIEISERLQKLPSVTVRGQEAGD